MRIVRLIGVFTALCLLAGCAGKPPGGVKIGKPYAINGKIYNPAYQPDYDKIGKASWYGPGFHGKKTASGERFDQNDMTAAHPTLPMPSVVRVTNLDNGRSAIIRINDRGPFHSDRIIDLSKEAAKKLGVIGTGVAQVRVQYLPEDTERYIAEADPEKREANLARLKSNPLYANAPEPAEEAVDAAFIPEAEPPPVAKDSRYASKVSLMGVSEAQASEPPASSLSHMPARQHEEKVAPPPGWYIQAGSFSMERNAQSLADKLSSMGDAELATIDVAGKTWYRVRLGPLESKTRAEDLVQYIASLGVQGARIIHH